MYRYTKERNINELRHNSMYGCENNRNSPVYRYTRTAPEIQRKRRTYCVAWAPIDVTYKNNTHIPSISMYNFPKDIVVWPKWMHFDCCHQGDFSLQCQRPYALYRWWLLANTCHKGCTYIPCLPTWPPLHFSLCLCLCSLGKEQLAVKLPNDFSPRDTTDSFVKSLLLVC